MTPTAGKQLFFGAAMAAIPILFFLLLEVGLRLVSFGVDMRLFNETRLNGARYYSVNPDVVHRYFSDPDFGTYVSRDRFLVEKPEQTYRIFCLGASTTIGYPYMYNGAFSSLLKDRLDVRFPDRHFEVVNLGITAVNSYTVAEIAREVMDYQPDLLIVYAGHNEFYGALGVGSTEYAGSAPWLVRLYLKLQRTRTVQLLRQTFAGASRAFRDERDSGQLMEKLARDRQIPIGSSAYETARRYFEHNYRSVIQTAREHNVDVLVSTLASNLRDQPPFVSVHRDDLSGERQLVWRDLVERGREAAAERRWTEAASSYREAMEIDDGRADLYFYLAQCLDSLGDHGGARDAYRTARDLDALPFRAGSDFNEIITRLAGEYGVPLVDMDSAFAKHARHGIPGDDLFWEHVHPRFEGYLLMARIFTGTMEQYGMAASRDQWSRAHEPSDSFFAEWAGLTKFDHEVARLRIELLKSRWPFRETPISLDFQPSSLDERAAWDNLRGLLPRRTAHEQLARAYRERGDLSRAAEHSWAIAKMNPHDPTYYVRTGDIMAQQHNFQKAAEAFRYALRIDKSAEIDTKLGIVLYQLKDFAGTITHLESALQGSTGRSIPGPMRAHMHTLLCTAYFNMGNMDKAEDHLERLKQLAPDSPQIAALESALRGMARDPSATR